MFAAQTACGPGSPPKEAGAIFFHCGRDRVPFRESFSITELVLYRIMSF